MPRPIEIHAHDPLRYVGDMLAWIHQSVASESELLHNLIEGEKFLRNSQITEKIIIIGVPSKETGKKNRPKDNKEGGMYNESSKKFRNKNFIVTSESLQKVMDTIFEGVCRPFKVTMLSINENILKIEI